MFTLIQLKEIPKEIYGEARIIETNENLYTDTVTIQYQQMKFNMQTKKDLYTPGDIIYIKADVKSYRNQTIPFGFNQKNYYLSSNIQGYLNVKEISLIRNGFSMLSYREHLLDEVAKLKTSVYIKALIFGEKEFSKEQSTLLNNLGIMYLLTISGMHVYALFKIIDWILFYLSLSSKIRHLIKITIYIILLYLNLFSIGVLRLFIMYLLYIINQKFTLRYQKLDLLTFTFLVMLTTNIYLIYHQGFLITFLIMNFLYLMEFRYRGLHGYMKRLVITTIIFIVVLPFNKTFSPLLILTLPLIIGIVTGPLFIGMISVMLVKELDGVMSQLTNLFESLILFLNNKNISFHLPALNIYQYFIYFTIVILLFRSNKIVEVFSRILFLFLFFIGITLYSSAKESVIFLDVGQGDSTVIQSSGCVIVIDAFNNIERYLKNQGIYSIDYLILTHGDLDHTKEVHSILEGLSVDRIVLSLYDSSYMNYQGEIIYVKSGDQLNCNTIHINILGPLKKYASANNNSIVLQMEIDGLVYLFTGDIEKEAEADLVKAYGYHLKSDILKVAHHGSVSSSTSEFLSYVRPTVSVLSLGYENKYNFPDPKVMERLIQYSSTIYRTDIHGSIIYTPSKKKEKWRLLLPI
ncbi:MAG: DNA internalization-related competence protein ComEC/Rec2 [Acholeplasmataceae bacterium]|nr:DNA internalization-related competence protein ComEC/Rec2 [Acholeplasmataceae bacterium]